MLEQGLQTGPS